VRRNSTVAGKDTKREEEPSLADRLKAKPRRMTPEELQQRARMRSPGSSPFVGGNVPLRDKIRKDQLPPLRRARPTDKEGLKRKIEREL